MKKTKLFKDLILGFNVMNYFAFFSTLYLYLPIIIKQYSLDNQYIGIVSFLYSMGSVLSSFYLANYIENFKNKKLIINIIIIIQITLLTLMILINNYFALAALVFLIGYFGSSFIASNISNSENKGITIGISSIGFVIGYLLGGIIQSFKIMILTIVLLFIISVILNNLFEVFKEEIKEEREKVNSWEIIKRNWYIYLSLFLRHTGAAGIWIYLSYILMYHYNLSLYKIGILHAINIFVQTLSNPILYRFIKKENKTILKMISIGYILSAFYFLSFPMSKNILVLSLLQVILGLSFTLLYLGNIEYLSENNKEKITSLTLVSSSFSLANSVGAILSTLIIKNGYFYLFLNGFILSLVSFLIITIYYKANH